LFGEGHPQIRKTSNVFRFTSPLSSPPLPPLTSLVTTFSRLPSSSPDQEARVSFSPSSPDPRESYHSTLSDYSFEEHPSNSPLSLLVNRFSSSRVSSTSLSLSVGFSLLRSEISIQSMPHLSLYLR